MVVGKKNLLINPNISFVFFRERHASRDLFFLFARSFVLYIRKLSFRRILNLWNSFIYIKRKKLQKKLPSSDSHVTAQHTQWTQNFSCWQVWLFCVVYIHLNCYYQIEVNFRKKHLAFSLALQIRITNTTTTTNNN